MLKIVNNSLKNLLLLVNITEKAKMIDKSIFDGQKSKNHANLFKSQNTSTNNKDTRFLTDKAKITFTQLKQTFTQLRQTFYNWPT